MKSLRATTSLTLLRATVIGASLIVLASACRSGGKTQRSNGTPRAAIVEDCRKRGGILDVDGNCNLSQYTNQQPGVWYPGLVPTRTTQVTCLTANQSDAGRQYPNRYRWVSVQGRFFCLDVMVCLQQSANSPHLCEL